MCSFSVFYKTWASSHLLSKNLTFITTANSALSFNNFNKILVLGFIFSYTFSLTVLLKCRPPKQYDCFEFIYLLII